MGMVNGWLIGSPNTQKIVLYQRVGPRMGEGGTDRFERVREPSDERAAIMRHRRL
jgi:hypothetical protein